ncbi:ABC transporter ATP-binding protein [Ponticoccus sp. SC2-23]|uniref:dipeptide ABC transporter ATP-binding protein n=1 Tax=Alexandriicola marinus TaxID=2081710 RepID=UPI000FD77670|nr:ABC transporter ATP-binding protein [Alexandriicola marinus]MBM1221417.1 ABC transporter ATP-binding protein [Ponticoccus sp. SC6-9]MBM1226458.1 ABC transporter ATP-binding protein [Ponticoccus sp. SC6-15]MBM1230409.1 ABC transporter ATP-binding protein [Ponticoccus sp. SC6-38]MBM1234932.1 ABC transporter ATP-binding protein [Ponticoccus sp. SC6-45]MBM1239430.1 ABC transporter ATP-binding protein [Ponticoccus sp. SC6-49]MBM1243212.1 ABC transporter ATP-binding protein [Ponticoccus sp. SC2-
MKKAEPLLKVRDLRVGYEVPGDLVVPVEGVSFDLNPHEVVGLVGDAGSGKSTTALALMGLARPPGKILGGTAMFDGRDLLSLPDDEIRAIRGRDIGIIVQNPRAALNPMLRVGRQIGYAYRAHNRVSEAEARKQAVEMLRLVGINDPERRVEAYAHELSGGMAQRALIAMALSSTPKLLIADEPTSGLDVTIQAQFLDEMWNTVQKTGSAMLLVTQELGVIANFCDRVLVLHQGRIVEDAPVRQFFSDPQHPYSQEVLRFYHERSDGFPEQVSGGAGFLRTEQLTKHFPLRNSDKVVQAVDKVTISVAKGEAVGLVGESGSGKTTVGRCLMRLEHPTAGAVVLDGQDITALNAAEMRKMRSRMQIVFQDPFDSVNPRWTVADILDEPLRVHEGGDKAKRRSRAIAALEQVNLDPSLMQAKPRDLGASTLQRINIARALICNPEFVVLDEPTSVLAPRARNSLIALLARLQKELGISYLFISHDLTTVRYLCQRVAVMYLGQIVEEGTVEQVFSAPQHPYSQALLSAHLMPDPTRRRVDHPVPAALDGEIPSPIDVPKGCYLASRCRHVTETCRANPQVLSELGDGRTVRCERVVKGEITPEDFADA